LVQLERREVPVLQEPLDRLGRRVPGVLRVRLERRDSVELRDHVERMESMEVQALTVSPVRKDQGANSGQPGLPVWQEILAVRVPVVVSALPVSRGPPVRLALTVSRDYREPLVNQGTMELQGSLAKLVKRAMLVSEERTDRPVIRELLEPRVLLDNRDPRDR
jgi:hypothetical protein